LDAIGGLMLGVGIVGAKPAVHGAGAIASSATCWIGAALILAASTANAAVTYQAKRARARARP
jgi:hypothetical protein